MTKLAQRLGVLAILTLVYLIVLAGCLRSGALLINERDDFAFVAALLAYATTIPATLVFAVMATRCVQALLKGDQK